MFPDRSQNYLGTNSVSTSSRAGTTQHENIIQHDVHCKLMAAVQRRPPHMKHTAQQHLHRKLSVKLLSCFKDFDHIVKCLFFCFCHKAAKLKSLTELGPLQTQPTVSLTLQCLWAESTWFIKLCYSSFTLFHCPPPSVLCPTWQPLLPLWLSAFEKKRKEQLLNKDLVFRPGSGGQSEQQVFGDSFMHSCTSVRHRPSDLLPTIRRGLF